MIAYATVGSNDPSRARAFYDALLPGLGYAPAMEHPSGGRMYATAQGAMFAVLKPFDGMPATVGNGTMIAFGADSPEQVDAIHDLALSLGGVSEGAPGPRGPEGGPSVAYVAYFRDLDGNKLCVIARL